MFCSCTDVVIAMDYFDTGVNYFLTFLPVGLALTVHTCIPLLYIWLMPVGLSCVTFLTNVLIYLACMRVHVGVFGEGKGDWGEWVGGVCV